MLLPLYYFHPFCYNGFAKESPVVGVGRGMASFVFCGLPKGGRAVGRLRRILPVFAALLLLGALFFCAPKRDGAVPVASDFPLVTRRVLLVPLDSRPPCGRFVVDAARIVGVEVVLPPAELLDEYFRPGDAAALRAWTAAHIAECDAAILSVDQLLHGGLLASRQAKQTPDDEEALLRFLRELHEANPGVPLYAFSILPRMTPPDGFCDWHEQQRLMRYSRLIGRIARGTRPAAGDLEAMEALRASIAPENLSRYEALFADYAEFGLRLIGLAEDGTLRRLVIGQDDSEPDSIPNLVLRRLSETLAKKGIGEDRVFLAQGADELALSMLAADEAGRDGFVPRVALRYNDASTPARVLPYMGVTMEETAREKIRFVGGVVSGEEAADFLLYLSAHDKAMRREREAAAREVASLLGAGRAVALVDLAGHFRADETLFPLLAEQGAPLHALAAYAGWNTASNSVGTAVSHAVLLELAKRRARTEADVLRLAAAHLSFLDGRFLEDYFYLKDGIDHINFSLEKCGAQNGRGLEYNYNYPLASLLLESAIEHYRAGFVRSGAFRAPVAFDTPGGPLRLRAVDLAAAARYPWTRTFEIDLRAKIRMEKLPRHTQE